MCIRIRLVDNFQCSFLSEIWSYYRPHVQYAIALNLVNERNLGHTLVLTVDGKKDLVGIAGLVVSRPKYNSRQSRHITRHKRREEEADAKKKREIILNYKGWWELKVELMSIITWNIKF